MTISGIVVACQPVDIDGLSRVLSDLPWVDVHYTDPRGRLVVTIEAENIDQSMERLKELQGLPRVLVAELAEYTIEDDQGQDRTRPATAPETIGTTLTGDQTKRD